MLRWIAYIKSMNPQFKHIAGKVNTIIDILLRTRYDDEEAMIDNKKDGCKHGKVDQKNALLY